MAESDNVMRYVNVPAGPERADNLTAPEFRALHAINQKVGASESLEAIIDCLFKSTQSISPCDRISLAFLEEGSRRVVSHYTRAKYEPLMLRKGYAEDLRSSSLQRVLEQRTPRIINDLHSYGKQRPSSASTKLLLREGVRSSMTCPLLVDGRVVGLMFRSSRRANAYDDHQVLIHQATVERLSQAVAKTYRIEQLAAANRAYLEMLGFVSEKLQGPIGSILADAKLLTEGYYGELNPNHRKRIERMCAKSKHVLGFIHQYLELSRIESSTLKATLRSGVDFMADVVAASIDIIEPQIESKGMTLVCAYPDALPLVACDPGLLKTVLVNLLSNAAKYGRDGGEVRLRVECTRQRLKVSVWNEGPGFPASERLRLFRKFSRLHTPGPLQQEGAGVGLYTSWWIIQLHKGKLGANSEHGRWAEFFFEIPQTVGPA